MKHYRNRKLLQAAKGEDCKHCGRRDGTIVAAHSNSRTHGKGLGLKSHDIFIADLCVVCHANYDRKYTATLYGEDYLCNQEDFDRAMVKTILNRLQRGILS